LKNIYYRGLRLPPPPTSGGPVLIDEPFWELFPWSYLESQFFVPKEFWVMEFNKKFFKDPPITSASSPRGKGLIEKSFRRFFKRPNSWEAKANFLEI
jgi:hypothetical protein